MTKYIVAALILAALAPFAARAQTPALVDTVIWTNPTENTDGSALTNLSAIIIRWGHAKGGPYTDGSRTVSESPPVTLATIARSNDALRCYVLVAVNSAGAESVQSAEACMAIPTVPKSPGGIAVKWSR
ncbi:MAG: hypothetical protein ACYDDA_03765 [Acidiferrobacteraceae bacterium]